MNWPSDSRNAIRMPLSPLTFGSRGPSLLVPTKIMPPATTGLPYACEPSSATHLTFFFVFTSDVVDIPLCRLRLTLGPHLSARTNFPLAERLHLELHRVPSVRLPGEINLDGALYFRLPRLQFNPLVAA